MLRGAAIILGSLVTMWLMRFRNSQGQVAATEHHKQGLGDDCRAETTVTLVPRDLRQWLVHRGISRDKIYGKEDDAWLI